MKGYVSFLIVLAGLAIFLAFSNSYYYSKSANLSQPISLEKAEQISLQMKRGLLMSAKYGAIAGFAEYLAEVAGSGGTRAFDLSAAKERAKQGAYLSMSAISISALSSEFNISSPYASSDFEAVFWCGEVSSERELDRMALSSLNAGMAVKCEGCSTLGSPACADYINLGISQPQPDGVPSIASLYLGSEALGEKPKIFGITLYSKKFNISKVAYIPTSQNAFDAPFPAPEVLMR